MDNNLSQNLLKEDLITFLFLTCYKILLTKTEVLTAFSTDHSPLLFSLDLRKDEIEVKGFGNLITPWA